MTPSYAETLRLTTSESTAAAPAREAPLGITSAPALNGNPVGKRTELGRYTISAGERVLYGQRISGTVRVTDRPASGRGRSVLVERGLEQDGYAALRALVADYIEQAERHDEIPMLVSLLDVATEG
jgi:hypothetical protein